MILPYNHWTYSSLFLGTKLIAKSTLIVRNWPAQNEKFLSRIAENFYKKRYNKNNTKTQFIKTEINHFEIRHFIKVESNIPKGRDRIEHLAAKYLTFNCGSSQIKSTSKSVSSVIFCYSALEIDRINDKVQLNSIFFPLYGEISPKVLITQHGFNISFMKRTCKMLIFIAYAFAHFIM